MGRHRLVLESEPTLYSSVSLHSVIQQLYDLNTGVIGQGVDRHERPHKPVLLLAVLELMDHGAETGRVVWSGELRDAFKRIFAVVRKRDDQASPQLPFRYLASDGFWTPVLLEGGTRRSLTWEPRIKEPGEVFAELSPELATLLADRQNRQWIRERLVSRYFSAHRAALLGPAVSESRTVEPSASGVEKQRARSAVFREMILRMYGYRCAACGLDIGFGSLPMGLLEAAHLVPFAETQNDHPTNGMALCRNHHWAMDSHLIAPSLEGVWRCSRRVIPRRSRGEQELSALDGLEVITPKDEVYQPAEVGLRYRWQKMLEAQG